MQPIIDFHCDLLTYLAGNPDNTLYKSEDIGCAIPLMKTGGVKVQVCAIYTDVVPESADQGLRQAQIFEQLPQAYPGELMHFHQLGDWSEAADRSEVTLIAAVESATGLGAPDDSMDQVIQNLDRMLAHTGPLAYISLTHHKKNRFGGGNNDSGSITEDGKALLDAMEARGIPLCLSHTSDALAETAIAYLEEKGYRLPVLASHSNFRPVCDEVRNLPDYLAQKIVDRGGVIGLNFLRKYLDPVRPEGLFDHIDYAAQLGVQGAVVYGADYFYFQDMPAELRANREPFYLPAHADATCYPTLHQQIADRWNHELAASIAWDRGLRFFKRFIPTQKG